MDAGGGASVAWTTDSTSHSWKVIIVRVSSVTGGRGRAPVCTSVVWDSIAGTVSGGRTGRARTSAGVAAPTSVFQDLRWHMSEHPNYSRGAVAAGAWPW